MNMTNLDQVAILLSCRVYSFPTIHLLGALAALGSAGVLVSVNAVSLALF